MTIQTIADHDGWLEPYRPQLEDQQTYIAMRTRQLLAGQPIEEFALGHLYFGLHQTPDGWVFREWAPNAAAIYILTEQTSWLDHEEWRLARQENGIWEINLPKSALSHGDHYKLNLHYLGGSGHRLPSYVNYVVQDPDSHLFDAVVWQPTKNYQWQNQSPTRPAIPLIYEAHVGMSSEEPEVASYRHFTNNVLPRIKNLGYNTVQLMAIQEHPYYGSFGYLSLIHI